jgi:hypothetical protein
MFGVMEIVLLIMLAIVVALSGFMTGYVVRGKRVSIDVEVIDKYRALTSDSKYMVKGYIEARIVKDEQTTWKRRG